MRDQREREPHSRERTQARHSGALPLQAHSYVAEVVHKMRRAGCHVSGASGATSRKEAIIVDRAPSPHFELEDHALGLVREAARGLEVSGSAGEGAPAHHRCISGHTLVQKRA